MSTAHSVAAQPEILGIQHEIRYLTNALNGYSTVGTQSDNIHGGPSARSLKTQAKGFAHISHLLSLGTHESPGVAVTGIIKADSTEIVVVSTYRRVVLPQPDTGHSDIQVKNVSVETDLPDIFKKMVIARCAAIILPSCILS
jgi:hypothetical protein